MKLTWLQNCSQRSVMRHMNCSLKLIGWSLILIVFVGGCNTGQLVAPVKRTFSAKYRIDGTFDDWKTYETAKTTKGIDWSTFVVTGNYHGILQKEFYYDNDDKYLYLFFKCEPTIQRRYDKHHSTGNLGSLYLDVAAGTPDAGVDLKNPRLFPGTEIEISFPIGIYISMGEYGPEGTSGCFVAYQVNRWDEAIEKFTQSVRTGDSRMDAASIAHGKDGVEAAIQLADLGLSKGNEGAFYFSGDLVPRQYVNRTVFRLK